VSTSSICFSAGVLFRPISACVARSFITRTRPTRFQGPRAEAEGEAALGVDRRERGEAPQPWARPPAVTRRVGQSGRARRGIDCRSDRERRREKFQHGCAPRSCVGAGSTGHSGRPRGAIGWGERSGGVISGRDVSLRKAEKRCSENSPHLSPLSELDSAI
jgi:hypothetical protein